MTTELTAILIVIAGIWAGLGTTLLVLVWLGWVHISWAAPTRRTELANPEDSD